MNLTKDQIKTVAILLSGTFLAVLNITLLMTALPTIMVDMNIDAPTAQWLSSAYGMTEAIVIPMSAYIMGKLSTRKLYAGGLAVFAFGSFLGAISPVFPVLLAGRILQAAATGALMPAVMSLVLLTFPREKRGSGMGIVSLIIGFAPSIGPTLSGFLVDTIGWRYMFVLSGVLAVIIITASLFILKNQDVFKPTNFDIASVLMSSVGLFTLLYGLSHVTSSQIVLIPLAMIIVGVVVMILFLLRQRRLESPMLQVSVLESGRYRVAAIIMFCVMAALVGIDVMLPLYAQNVLGLSAARTGLIMMPGALLGAFVGMIAGRLFDKLGARPVAITGATLVLASSLGMLLLFNDHTNVWVITGVFMLLSLGLQSTMPPVNTWGINSLKNEVVQHGNALMNTFNQIGGSAGTAVLVSVMAWGVIAASSGDAPSKAAQMHGIHVAYFVTVALMLVMFAVVVVFVHDKRVPAANVQESRDNVEVKEPQAVQNATVPRFVKDIMNRHSPFVPDTCTIRDVTLALAETETSGVPVVDSSGALVGFVSDGDILNYLGKQTGRTGEGFIGAYYMIDDQDYQERFRTLLEMNVMALATKKVIAIQDTDDLDEAARVLSDRRIKKVPVVDSEGKLVGALSRRNFINALAGELYEDNPREM